MSYVIQVLSLVVIVACLVVLHRTRHEETVRRPHLYLLFTGYMIAVWGNAACQPYGGCSVAVIPYWEAIVVLGLVLSLLGLVRLTWFMWLRNGHLKSD